MSVEFSFLLVQALSGLASASSLFIIASGLTLVLSGGYPVSNLPKGFLFLGQGTVLIQLAGHVVTVDHGDGKVESSAEPEQFINQQLGMFVPLRSLRYWVVGLPEPAKAFEETPAGFKQAGWLSEFKQMQRTNKEAMPRKMTVTNEQVKVKLIIDHWILNDPKTN